MKDRRLHVIVRTPRHVALDIRVRSLRVQTETGWVCLRPRCEALFLAVETGLLIARLDEGVQYVGIAGGLLTCDGQDAAILTPLAVVGSKQEEIQSALNAALSDPTEEVQARAALERLEGGILKELRTDRLERTSRGGVL